MYIINFILVFRLLFAYSQCSPSCCHLLLQLRPGRASEGLDGPMKQECLVSFLRRSRTSTMSLSPGNLFLSLSGFHRCILVPLSFFPPKHRERLCSRSRTTVGVYTVPSCLHDDAHRFSVSVGLSAAGSERASVHKRVINYLRVGHVFPPYSPSRSLRARSFPLLVSLSRPHSSSHVPALCSLRLWRTHTHTHTRRHWSVSFVTLSRSRTRSIPEPIPCLHTRSYVNSA